ncbi:NAD dependent epimerase dehydratase [Paramyrothecium foliicola]|nr:NAD dependent epimerase dehydratase [Paramyrothecium foliicola]
MAKDILFITGATGFIGAWVALASLKAGYRVRLSVRRSEQIETLQKRFSEHAGNIEFVLIPDFTAPNAFAEGIAGAGYVIHVASPMLGKGSDFKRDFVAPAVTGTISVLNTAKTTPSVKRVLVMSSILAILPLGILEGKDESHPTDFDENLELPDGPEGAGRKYQGSKILAHKATEKWVIENQPGFPVLTFHPTFVIGPSLSQKTPGEIDDINKFFLDTVRSGDIVIPSIFVDVRDVAEAFIKGLDSKVSQWQTFPLSTNPPLSWDDIAIKVQALYPNAGFKLKSPIPAGPAMQPSTEAAESILGLKWTSQEEMIRGVIDQQLVLEAHQIASE